MGCTNAWAPIVSWLPASTCCWEALLCVRHGSTRGRSTSSASRHGNRPQKDPISTPNPGSDPIGGGWRTQRRCLEDQLVLFLCNLQCSNPHTVINDVVPYCCAQIWVSVTMENPKAPISPHIPVLILLVVLGGPGGDAWRTSWFCPCVTYNVPTHTL